MIKNILVTGGVGYIGSHLCIKLLQEGYNITIIDNFINSKKETLKKIKNISNKNFFFFKIDIQNTKKVTAVLKKKKIHLVIHLAALKKVNESIKYSDRYYKNNIFWWRNAILST